MKESANIAQFDELNPILIFYEKNSLTSTDSRPQTYSAINNSPSLKQKTMSAYEEQRAGDASIQANSADSSQSCDPRVREMILSYSCLLQQRINAGAQEAAATRR